jgi:hypothetical protein
VSIGGMDIQTTQVGYLRRFFYWLIGITIFDVINAATASGTTLKAATASSTSALTWVAADLITGGKAALLACPRQVRFTVAGVTPSDVPATARVTGQTRKGPVIETVTLPQTATTVDTENFFTRIDEIYQPAGQGTAGLVSVGFTTALGLFAKIKGRGAASAVFVKFLEWIDGVPVTPAVYSGTSTLVSGTVDVTAPITASSVIKLTMRDPGAGALTTFVELDAPVASRNVGAGTFTVNAIDNAKAVLATAVCTFDWEITNGTSTPGTLTSSATHKPYGSYTPHASVIPNAARDYLVAYESDPS